MSVYKVRIGDSIVEADGLAGLIALVREGRLGPDDPVFVPSTGKWHYARALKQLREYFPADAAPPPSSVSAPAAPPRAAPSPARRAAPPVPGRIATPSAPAGAPRPEPPQEQEEEATRTEGAQVVRFRRGKWTPEGAGVDVPVFSYDVDASPPSSLRTAVLVVVALVVVGSYAVYRIGYAHYLNSFEAEESVKSAAVGVATPVARRAATPPPRHATTPAATPGHVATIAAAPTRAPTPVPTPTLPVFDAGPLRSRVATTALAPVTRPEQFGPAIRVDLTRLAVPIHDAALTPVAGARGASVPFVLRVDYAPESSADALHRAKARYTIVAMAGRRVAELHVNVASFHLRTLAGGKVASDVSVPVDLMSRVWAGSARPDDVTALFAGK